MVIVSSVFSVVFCGGEPIPVLSGCLAAASDDAAKTSLRSLSLVTVVDPSLSLANTGLPFGLLDPVHVLERMGSRFGNADHHANRKARLESATPSWGEDTTIQPKVTRWNDPTVLLAGCLVWANQLV
ncbi:MAG: hypothetical protein VYA32_04490 [Planctomycetota bacterium]|nr:hypothetical protein [Planctomycetota bacterium]MEC9008211.1 hypothetical protein [Planctomycetota bacterium]